MAAADDALDRHRPILAYDRAEHGRTTAVDSMARRLGEEDHVDLDGERPGREVVYGHHARDGDGRRWLQYWLFFLANPQDRGIVRTGRHEGDWEFVQLRLDVRGRPDAATLAQHRWAEGCTWARLERAGDAPVVYVANGSHALYSSAGTHNRPLPDPDDEADGRGRRVRPAVVAIQDRSPAWVGWPGRWGDSDGWLPFEEPSPRGPGFQDDGRFRDPAGFHADARGCGSGPPQRVWQWPLLGAMLLAGALVGLRRRRRRTYNPPP